MNRYYIPIFILLVLASCSDTSKKDIDVLITSGKLAKNMCRGFMKNPGNKQDCRSYDNWKAMLNELENIIKSGDIILVKGSRANKLEEIVNYLKKWQKR